ncbi:MAG: PAS domain S-box protein, partial [Chitinophaga rupis]
EDAVSGKQNIYREAYSPVLEKWLSMSLFYSPTGVSIFFRNITAQRKAQEEARLQEEKYSMLVQRITDAFIALDKQWNYTYLNKQAGELIHHDPASLIGKNVWEVFPDAVGSKTYEAFHQAMKAQRFISNEDYYAPLDLWQENHIYPSPDGLTIFIRNITEKKKAEEQIRKANERFELVVNATNDVIWDWDIPSNAMWWNKNYYDHFGYDKDSTIHNVSSWQAGVHPEDRDRVIAGIRSSMQSGEQVWTDEYRFLKADGSICFILDYGYILYDKGNAYRMVGAMLDITGIKNAEQDIRRLEKERMESRMEEQKRITQAILQAQEKERNAIGIELHDNVNQILAGTKLLLSIGMNYPDRDAEIIPAALKNIEEAIEENRKIAHELVAPDFQEIRLASQLQQLPEDMLQKAGLDSYIEDAGFDEKILSDEQKLAVYRIVQEQCTNILKYAGASTVRFQLATEGLMFKMEIADDGKGMDPGKLVTGIGLRNIRSRIHVFNGELDITTAPGKGFLLEIRMPLKK